MITINVSEKKKKKVNGSIVIVTESTIAVFKSMDKAKKFIMEAKDNSNITLEGCSYDDDSEKVLLINLGVIKTD